MARIAFEEISPRRGYPDFDAYIQELEKAFANKIKPELLKLFELRVARWKHKVDFRAVKRITPLEVSVYVYPTGPNKEIWLWVSGGTRAHTIIPRVAGVPMRFRKTYLPRTQPHGGGQRFGGPGRSVGPWVATKKVDHPGIAPREFEKSIAQNYRTRFMMHVFQAARLGARRL